MSDHLNPMIDPEHERYRRQYPRFPGMPEILRLLRLRSTRGGYLDAILSDLRTHAPLALDHLTHAFNEETDERIRALLAAELAETGDQRLVGLFAQLLSDPNESVASWAEVGLRRIDTKQARKVLFEHRGPQRRRPDPRS